MNLRKVNRHVDFPLILDLAPFCSASCKVFNYCCGNFNLKTVFRHSIKLVYIALFLKEYKKVKKTFILCSFYSQLRLW